MHAINNWNASSYLSDTKVQGTHSRTRGYLLGSLARLTHVLPEWITVLAKGMGEIASIFQPPIDHIFVRQALICMDNVFLRMTI